MGKYIVYYALAKDFQMIIEAKDNNDAHNKAIEKIDPNNNVDWMEIKFIAKVNEAND